MSHQTLIVARMDPTDADAVAQIFAESDAGALPGRLGVTRRSLFNFHGLYFHLIEAEKPVAPALDRVRSHEDFISMNTRLAHHISPFDPQTWRGPADAMAHQFYRWSPGPS
jgi:cyclase